MHLPLLSALFKEYDIVDDSVKLLFSMLYIQPSSPFYYEELLYSWYYRF